MTARWLVAHQPNYLPWAGLFAKIASGDRFVVLDHVQFEKGGRTARAVIEQHDGTQIRLTIPVHQKLESIDAVELAEDQRWRVKHWKALSFCYGRDPGWATLKRHLEPLYCSPPNTFSTLNEFTSAVLFQLSAILGLSAKWVGWSSDHSPPSTDELGGVHRMLEWLTWEFGCDGFVSGSGAKKYLDPDLLRIGHRWFEWSGDDVSVVHSIARLGIDAVKRMIDPCDKSAS